MVLLGVTVLARDAGPGAAGSGAPLADEEILARLRDYLRIDTSNPPGNELKAARFFKNWFDEEGIPTEVFEFTPGRANLVARLKGSGARRPILLLNHMDS